MNTHKIEIIQQGDDEISDYRNTKLFFDGFEVKGVQSLVLEIVPLNYSILKLELVGHFKVGINGRVEYTKEKLDVVNGAGMKVGEIEV